MKLCEVSGVCLSLEFSRSREDDAACRRATDGGCEDSPLALLASAPSHTHRHPKTHTRTHLEQRGKRHISKPSLPLVHTNPVPSQPSKMASTSSSASISSILQQLKRIHDSPSTSSANEANQLLLQAKIQLAQSGLLLPGTFTNASKSDLETARDILSYGALLSVRNEDTAAFERYLAQLKPFWDPQNG